MADTRKLEDAVPGKWRRWKSGRTPFGSGDPEEGSTTVEYAIGAVATAGFAGLLLAILKSGAIRSVLQGIIESALTL